MWFNYHSKYSILKNHKIKSNFVQNSSSTPNPNRFYYPIFGLKMTNFDESTDFFDKKMAFLHRERPLTPKWISFDEN